MSINWTHAPYISDSDILSGYPVLSATPIISEFDIESVWTVFIQDSTLNQYFHPRTAMSIFDLSKVYSTFNVLDKGLYGYPIPFVPELPKPGAFANTTQITSITLPISVESLGRYTFYNSALEDISLSPTCVFYSTTFPVGCDITYYNTTITSVTFPINPIAFMTGDNAESILSNTIVDVSVTDGVTTESKEFDNFTFSGLSTASPVSSANATLQLRSYADDIIDTYNFTYSVMKYPVVLIPAMTSTSQPIGTIISSGYASSYYPYYVFNGDTSSGFSPLWTDSTNTVDGSYDACYVGYEFPYTVRLHSFDLYYYAETLCTFTYCIQARHNSVWSTVVPTQTSHSNGDYNTTFNLSSYTDCDAIRLCILSVTGQSTFYTGSSYDGFIRELRPHGWFLNDLFSCGIEVGSIYSSDGTLYDRVDRLRTDDYIPITQGRYMISSAGVETMEIFGYYYDTNKSFIEAFGYYGNWAELPFVFDISGSGYLKFVWHNLNNTSMNVSDIYSAQLVSVS